MIRRACAAAIAVLVVSASADAQAKWQLVEDLRIGGGDDGPTMFGEISGLDVDKQGRIAVFDAKAFELRLFESSGKFLRTIGRKGQGPGEYTQVNGIRFAPDGSLWVNDHSNVRMVGFTAGGDFAKQIVVPVWGYSYRWDGVIDAQGRIVETFVATKPGADGKRESKIRRIDPVSARIDTVEVPSCLPSTDPPGKWFRSWRTERGGGNVSIPFAPTRSERIDPAGGIACAKGEEYRVSIVPFAGVAGAPVNIQSNSSPLSIPDAKRDSAVKAIYNRDSRFPVPPGTIDLSMVPATYPRIEQIDLDDSGRIWVRHKTAAGLALDVWSRAGRRLATIDAPERFVDKYEALVIRGNNLYAVVRDADDVPGIVRFRIQIPRG